ncbi:MAG: UpxY family transcription antiterminator [Chitinophagales bacterium]|jgi:transcription antitermination factor NusG|nr:UpxY family transcription antiterminator [Chitinophagales bacterium]
MKVKLPTMLSDAENIWHAIYLKPRQEKKVARILNIKKIEHYLPLAKVKKRYSDRLKTVEEPILKSYVFVKMTPQNYYEILNVDGVLRFVKSEKGGKIAEIHQSEIDNIRVYLQDRILSEIEFHNLNKGDEIDVTDLIKLHEKGIVENVTKNKVYILIKSLNYRITLSINPKA